jgi:hypothetical protein
VSFATLHKWVTYSMAGLGLAALFIGGELSLPVEVAILVAYCVSFFVDGPRIVHPAWQRGWNVALVALLAVEIVRGIAGEPVLPLGLEFTAALQLSRLCNRRSAAEHQQIAMLAFLHLCAATVLSTELAYGLAFIGFVVVAPWMLALTHLRSEIEGHYPGDPDPSRAADVRRVLASRRVVGAGFLAGTAALSVPLFALTALVFVVFPRVGLGLLAFGGGTPTHVAGFGGDVELGQVGLVRDDPTVVLRVTPPDLGERPPRRAAIRMRGTSFDAYDGRRWSRTLRGEEPMARMDETYLLGRVSRHTRLDTWSIVLDHLEDTVVFLPESTIELEIPPRVQSGVEVGRSLVLSPGLDIRYRDDDALGLRYVARTLTAEGYVAMRDDLEPGEMRSYLQVPEGHARVAELAREWTAGAATDRERAQAIVERLHGFEYSLSMQDPGGRPPLDAFLFEWRAGHCEYFSTAMAIMLRTLGIPSRDVTGFLGGRWNSYGRYYAITHGDAHSWVEVWIDGRWITFDPTPPGRSEIGIASGLFDELAEIIDALRTRWEDDVVSYDLRSQRSLVRSVWTFLRQFRDAPDAERARAETAADEPSSWRPALLVSALVVAFVLAWRLARRRLGTGRDRRAAIPEGARTAVALYRALERALAARGRGRPSDRTPREHAEQLARDGFAGAAAVSAITERYLEARYGGVAIEQGELARLREKLRAVERTS